MQCVEVHRSTILELPLLHQFSLTGYNSLKFGKQNISY